MPAGRRHLLGDQVSEFPHLEAAPLEQLLGVPLKPRCVDNRLAVRHSGRERPAYSETALVERQEAGHVPSFFEHRDPRRRADAGDRESEIRREERVGKGAVRALHRAPRR